MEIREYARILRRRARIPVVLVLAVTVVAGLWAVMTKPEYVATATVIAKSNPNDQNGKPLSFQEVATSNNVLLHVRAQLGLTDSVAELAGRVTVTGDQSNLYRVTATDPLSQRAVAIANAVGQEAATEYTQISSGVDQSVDKQIAAELASDRDRYAAAVKARLDYEAQHPGAATAPGDADQAQAGAQLALLQEEEKAAADAYDNFQVEAIKARVAELDNARNVGAQVVDQAAARPDTRTRALQVLYAEALAIVAGIGIVFALEYFDNSVREPEQAEDLVGAPVIGTIPHVSARTLSPTRGGA